MLEVARDAERLGYHSVWLYDHLLPLDRDAQPPTTFECWTSLAAIARETRRVRLGQLVSCNLYRNPALLAAMAATLDAASGGRCILGLGAGWDDEEYLAFGYPPPFPPVRERLRLLEDALRIVKPRLGRIPLLVGGNGERVLLRLVAEHADACNLTDSLDPDYYRHKLDVLRGHCERAGRDYASIRKTASFTVPDTPPHELAETLRAIVEAGIEEFVLYFDPPTDLERQRRFAAEVVPSLTA